MMQLTYYLSVLEIVSDLLCKFECKVVSKHNKYVMLKRYNKYCDSVFMSKNIKRIHLKNNPKQKYRKKFGSRG